jgi:hypothetical protein
VSRLRFDLRQPAHEGSRREERGRNSRRSRPQRYPVLTERTIQTLTFSGVSRSLPAPLRTEFRSFTERYPVFELVPTRGQPNQ